MMRFHTTLEAAEGQRYDALQQGAPQQPRVTLVLCLPPSEDTLAASRRLLRGTPFCLAEPVGTAALQMSGGSD